MTIYHHFFFPNTVARTSKTIKTKYCIKTHYLSVEYGRYFPLRKPFVVETKYLNVGLSVGLGIPLDMG